MVSWCRLFKHTLVMTAIFLSHTHTHACMGLHMCAAFSRIQVKMNVFLSSHSRHNENKSVLFADTSLLWFHVSWINNDAACVVHLYSPGSLIFGVTGGTSEDEQVCQCALLPAMNSSQLTTSRSQMSVTGLEDDFWSCSRFLPAEREFSALWSGSRFLEST